MQSILVISNRTCECPAVIDEVVRHAQTVAEASVMLVAPAVNSRLRHLVSDTDAALADARLRVENAVSELVARGVTVTGRVGDADPLQAIDDALVVFPADELILATHPPESSHWLERDLLARIAERYSLPLTHVVSRYGLGAGDIAVTEVRAG